MNDSEDFFDTSVLLYLLSADSTRAEKAERLLDHPGSRAICRVLPLTEETYDRGLGIAAKYRFSIYDSMIVASALLAGCGILWSEDFQHRQVIDGSLTVMNPFNGP